MVGLQHASSMSFSSGWEKRESRRRAIHDTFRFINWPLPPGVGTRAILNCACGGVHLELVHYTLFSLGYRREKKFKRDRSNVLVFVFTAISSEDTTNKTYSDNKSPSSVSSGKRIKPKASSPSVLGPQQCSVCIILMFIQSSCDEMLSPIPYTQGMERYPNVE